MFDSLRSRGLALSAVSALAITGVSFVPSSALAAPGDGDGVVMLSQLDGKASVRPDGYDAVTQYVDVVAERLDPDTTIRFEVNADPAADASSDGWTELAGQGSQAGRFWRLTWDASAFVGSTVSLRAVAQTDDGERSYSTVNRVAVTGAPAPDATAPHSVSVDGASPSGYFTQPYADSKRTATQIVVTGSTSALEGTVDLSWWRSSDGTFQGSTAAALTLGEGKVFSGGGNVYYDIGEFREALDITGYDAEADDDVLAVRGVRDSDSVAAMTTYEQTIGLIESLDFTDAGSRRPTANLRVTDTESSPVVGAEVRRSSDQSVVGYTDKDGLVTAEQDAGATETYYVNTTDADAYEPGVDFTTSAVTAPQFTPVVTDVIPVLEDGDYFDDDEYTDGDIALQVVDQEDKAIAAEGETVTYSLHPKGTDAPEPTTATTDAAGRVVIPFDPAGADGTYVLEVTKPESVGGGQRSPLELTAGDSTLTLTPDGTGTAASGGQITYTGTLSLDGHPLTDRSIDLTYARGTEAAPGTAADAGIVVGDDRVLATAATTDEDGEFSVTVADPVETGGPGEAGGILTATAPAADETDTATVSFTAAPVTPGPSGPTPPPAAPVTAPATVKLKLTGSSKGRAADKLKVASAKTAAGQRVRVYAKTGKGGWKVVKTVRLDRAGRFSLKLKDHNGTKVTSYRVKLIPTAVVAASTSNVKRLR